MKKKIQIILLIVLVTVMATSIFYLISYYKKTKNDNEIFKNLEQVGTNKNELENSFFEDDSELSNNVENNQTNVGSSNRQNSTLRNKTASYSSLDLKSLKIKNGDTEGWIKIDNTKINYPVMQNGDFYLHNNFYKKYSISGTPYLASYCNINSSDNLIIYGHHMSNGSMFAGLDIYKTYNGYKNHKYIKFFTLIDDKTIENQYEVVGAFTNVSWDAYKNKKNNSGSAALDAVIAGAMDNTFDEDWKKGKGVNPLAYNKPTKNCAQYLKDANTNFGIVVVYNRNGSVRMFQIYRKNILV